MQELTCSVEQCGTPAFARGMCQKHYVRVKKHGDPHVVKHKHDNNRLDPAQRKTCEQCGEQFGPSPRCSHAQWERRRFCSRACQALGVSAPRRINDGLDKRARYYWKTADAGSWWERQRRAEDQAELAWLQRRERKVRRATRPTPAPRQFTAGYCRGCGTDWIDYTARQPSGYCNECQDRRWRADSRHKRRAWKANANVVEVISPDVVFKRDGYRCQICKRKTRGQVPALTAPTVDHIVPLALGGDHSYLNVQCACFGCNSRKGATGAGDQLRLVA